MLACLVVGLLAPSIVAASFASPLDWSADGRWLAYTIIEPGGLVPPKKWLFPRDLGAEPFGDAPGAAGDDRPRSRVWVTRPDGTESVLIEESRWPASQPVWGPDGQSLHYGRFVADGDGGEAAAGAGVRGRYEVVARTGLEQSRAIPLQLELELNAERVAAIALAKPAVSADGRFLAVPKPERAGGLWVVRLDQDRVVQSFESAKHPAWSPDGRRLSFVVEDPGASGEATRALVVWNRDRGAESRVKVDAPLLDVPPVWSLDGQSLLAVAALAGGPAGPSQLDLIRVNLDTGIGARLMTLEAAAPPNQLRATAPRRPPFPRGAVIAGAGRRPITLELGLDRERDQALCLIDDGEGSQAFKWCNTRTQNTFKRFHPLDQTMRLGAPALSPDGQKVAFRVEDRAGIGLPAVCDLTTEAVTPIAPDADARDRWLAELAFRSLGLIEVGIKVHGGDESSTRATALPLPGEFNVDHPRQFRLRRLAKIAQGLIDRPRAEGSADEFAVFFAYLSGDFRAAESRLDRLEADDPAPEVQLRRLLLRAQILMGQGELERARGIVDYVGRATAADRRLVEETPLGPVVADIVGPERGWSQWLGRKLEKAPADGPPMESVPGVDPNVEMPAEPFAPDPGPEPGQFGAPLAPIPEVRGLPIPPEAIRLQIAPRIRIAPGEVREAP